MHSTALILFLSIVGFSLGQQGDRKWGEFLQPRPIAQVTANPGSENAFPAWYHMPPKQQHSPAYGYDRQPQTNQQVDQSYRGYPSFNRQPPAPSSSPYESPSAPRRPFPQPDDETAVQKYHKLLLRKPATTPRTNHRRTIDNTVPPHLRPVHGTRPTQGLPRPGEATDHPRIVLSKMKTVRPIVNRIRERLRLKKILPDGGVTPAPETPGPETTTEILEFEISATTPPSYPITKDSSPWHKLSWTRKATVESTTEIPTTANSTVTKGRFICNKTLSSAEKRENEKRPRIGPFKAKATWMTHPATTISTTTPSASREVTRPHTRWTLYDILSWPNAELLNAIRDVVSKFKASLDESGLDQDVRQMGRQLQNTWQQLRAGPTSVNEQLTQMFARSQSQDAPRK